MKTVQKDVRGTCLSIVNKTTVLIVYIYINTKNIKFGIAEERHVEHHLFSPSISKYRYISVTEYKSQSVTVTSYVGQLGSISDLLGVDNIDGLQKQVVFIQFAGSEYIVPSPLNRKCITNVYR